VEVHLEVDVAADVRDRGMTERDEVLSGEPGDADVVDAEGSNAR
jgi:hypothetical protein